MERTQATVVAEADPAAMPERSARILVADDAAANRELVSTILSQLGINAEVAHDGAEALAAVQVADFDLVLMDMHMPEMDGLEATRRIRALGGAFARLPIIALTANALQGDREACMAAGMNDYLAKPFKRTDLQQILQRWVQ